MDRGVCGPFTRDSAEAWSFTIRLAVLKIPPHPNRNTQLRIAKILLVLKSAQPGALELLLLAPTQASI